jgi:DNA-directed RNA polymerase subunit N (RpoN/RPB10)
MKQKKKRFIRRSRRRIIYPPLEKYTTENMGEIAVFDLGIIANIYGKYNSSDICIAGIGVVSFKEHFDYFIKKVNEYEEIYKITKKGIIDNFNCNKTVKDFFSHYFNTLKEDELLDVFGVTKFCDLDKKNIVEKLHYPRLWFENGIGGQEIEFTVQYWVSDKYDDIVLNIFLDDNLNITSFLIE